MSALQTIANAVTYPGRKLQDGAQAVGEKIDQHTRTFEASAAGNNVVGHFAGGAVQAGLSSMAGAVNLFGGVLDGKLLADAVHAVLHPVELAKKAVALPGKLVDAFEERPAHTLGASAIYLTGLGVGGARTVLNAEVVGAKLDQVIGARTAGIVSAGERGDVIGGLREAASTVRAGVRESFQVAETSFGKKAALSSRGGAAIADSTHSMQASISASGMPGPVKAVSNVVLSTPLAGGRAVYFSSNSPTGRLAMSSSVQPGSKPQRQE